MTIKMLIDASHEEETRVAIIHGNRVEEFDYESSAKKQIKGNVYLAKVTRVEPSLQAAFIEYGGNRHGFLAFSEIHPDYYQIPVSDREKLIAEEAAAYASLLEKEEEIVEKKTRKKTKSGTTHKNTDPDSTVPTEIKVPEQLNSNAEPEVSNAESEVSNAEPEVSNAEPDVSNAEPDVSNAEPEVSNAEPEVSNAEPEVSNAESDSNADDDKESHSVTKAENVSDAESITDLPHATEGTDETSADISEEDENDDETEISGSDITDDEEAEEKWRLKIAKGLRHKYKIQEVIKKNQILLIQVVKEERGNKGAALTTYLSLPGRYCVLMPNTLHNGGVSRKIANTSDRKSLKRILADLDMPSGIACIIRTAGQDRTKTEIKRDFDYLIRTWEGIRERTLKSVAPTMINEEGDLIKRSIRDLYTREVEEILVEGEKGYKTARSFMRLLMPSHARKIKHYTEDIPLLQRYQVENQLDLMYSPIVQLKSGGYIVINPTEALVSIDVNSGKATKEHNIEETARKTNLEAAEEVARQLRLRDMAGLIVIDFIDMDIRANNRAVEQKIKECLKSDRARIQIGKISSFGLMEMSRQRLRAGMLESSTRPCPHCEGSGVIRSVESQVLHIIRALEEEGIKGRTPKITLFLPQHIAIYMLNYKREKLVSLETQYSYSIEIIVDPSLTETSYRLELPNTDSRKSEKHSKSHSSRQQENRPQQKSSPERPVAARRNRQRNQSRRDKGNIPNKPDEDDLSVTTEAPQSSEAIKTTENQENKPRRRRRRSRRGPKNPLDVSGSVPVEKTSSPDNKNNISASSPENREEKSNPEQKTARRPYPPQARSTRGAPQKDTKVSFSKNDTDKPASPATGEGKSAVTAKTVPKPKETKPQETKPQETKPKKTEPKKTGWWQRTFG